jgi:hypothetical protein
MKSHLHHGPNILEDELQLSGASFVPDTLQCQQKETM